MAHPHSPHRLQGVVPDPRHARNASGYGFDDYNDRKPLPTIPLGFRPSPATAVDLRTSLPPSSNGRSEYSSFTSPPPSIGRPEYSSFTSPSTNRSSRPNSPVKVDRKNAPTTPVLGFQDNLAPPTPPSTGNDDRKPKRRSWFGRKEKDVQQGPSAWVVGHTEKLPFDMAGLQAGQPVPELWDVNGDCLVYLFPKSAGIGPSFRIRSSIFSSSPILVAQAFDGAPNDSLPEYGHRKQASFEARTAATPNHTPPATPERSNGRASSSQTSYSSRSTTTSHRSSRRELRLYLDIGTDNDPSHPPVSANPHAQLSETAEALVDIRNLFAFLSGQSLIATEKRSTLFSIFMRLAELLRVYEFSNLDSSTYGEVATLSFDEYIEELQLADVRTSCEKTIEGILLGERMRSVSLYNEAFTHGVGKHDEITKLNSSEFQLLSPVIVNRLGRAAIDLDKRTANIRHALEDFEFPSIFAGIANSKTADERKLVNFDAWREAFYSTRKFVLGYYKQSFGSWPPKASSKKNDLETSGLNRIVLRELYHDFSALYDLLTDRTDLTSRTADGVLIEHFNVDRPDVGALRHILSEYDRSSPPVKPPVPFDLPIIPSLKMTRSDFGDGDSKKDAKATAKKIKDEELGQLLQASSNRDAPETPFVKAFREFEYKTARSSNIQDICNLRMGQWMFMYAVLQALPMLVIDAPGIRHSKGVEYFLCEPPRSGVPWAREDAPRHQKNWYGVAGGGGVVSLPSDVIEHSIDGVYRRSHCWEMAELWSAGNPTLASAVHEQAHSHGAMAPPPPPVRGAGMRPDSRSSSPSAKSKRESMLMLGLEALPIPAGVAPDGRIGEQGRVASPSPSRNDPSKTFDAILANTQQGKAGNKKR